MSLWKLWRFVVQLKGQGTSTPHNGHGPGPSIVATKREAHSSQVISITTCSTERCRHTGAEHVGYHVAGRETHMVMAARHSIIIGAGDKRGEDMAPSI